MPGENRCAATCSKCHWNHTRKPPISWSSMDIMPQLGISSSFVIELPRAEMNTHYSHRRIFGAPNRQLWLQQLPLVKLQLGQNTLMSSCVHSEVHSDSCVVPSTTSSSMQHLTHMLPCLALAMHSHGGFLKWGYPQFSSILVGVSITNHTFGGTPIIGNLHMNGKTGKFWWFKLFGQRWCFRMMDIQYYCVGF